MTRDHDRRTFLWAGVILAPALVLAFLSWRSLREEREARRAEILRRASASVELAVRELESELRAIRDRVWREARAGSAATEQGRLVRPRPLPPDAPSLEERVRREDPALLPALVAAVNLEFGEGRPEEATAHYARLEALAESPSIRATLLHARARSTLQGARPDEARALYERLAGDHAAVVGESGIPYGVVAAARLVVLNPGPEPVRRLVQAMAASELPGHVRAFLLGDLVRTARPVEELLRREVVAARALEGLEDRLLRSGPLRDEVVQIEGRPFLLTYRSFPDAAAGEAVPLQDLPGPAARELLRASEGVAYAIEGMDAPAQGEILIRRTSREFPPLAVAAVLVDPRRLQVPPGRLVMAGGLVACLVAALAFGVAAMLRTVRRELAVAQMKSDFVSGVSHEFKTPLTSIRMFAEMLETGRAATEEKRREYHRLIHRESLRLSRLVENVLDFARIEEKRKTYALAQKPLREVVAAAAETFRALADGQAVQFRVRLEEELLAARVDADALTGAILNLLDNALKYGGEPAVIELALERRGGRAEISVRDNGPGVAPEERERIFEKFVRGSAAARGPAGGAGLGLAIVKHTMEAHGGSVSVEVGPGGGGRFVLTLPLCPGFSS